MGEIIVSVKLRNAAVCSLPPLQFNAPDRAFGFVCKLGKR